MIVSSAIKALKTYVKMTPAALPEWSESAVLKRKDKKGQLWKFY